MEPHDKQFEGKAFRIQTKTSPPVDLASVFLRDDEGQAEANARLIAAAPELLLSARMLLQVEDLDHQNIDKYTRWLVDEMETAIRAATIA